MNKTSFNPSNALRKNFRINGDRLWDSIMEMAKIGPGIAGGNNRQTLTDEDLKADTYLKVGVKKRVWSWA